MNNLHFSEEAQNDLIEIKTYIEEELLNPSAALATVSRITKSLRILQNHAQIGAPLSSPHLRSLVVMRQDIFIVIAFFGHAAGAVLAHADAVAGAA